MPAINVFAFNAFSVWLRTLRANPAIKPKYWPKLTNFLTTSLLTEPFRAYEKARYGAIIHNVQIDPEPLFIMGMARSGTTHLHNLLAQDPNYGYVTTLQGVAPGFVISSGPWLRRLIQRFLPKTRPMDNVAVSLDAPQEEEVAIANSCPHSFIYHLAFPQQAVTYFERYHLWQGVDENIRAEWRATYLHVLRVATYLSGGKPLVLKSPANSGRVPQLLEMFPNARFIHIYRDPLRTYLSHRNMITKILPPHQLQDMTMDEMEGLILQFMQRAAEKWLQDRQLIPGDRIVDVRYEDLTANPLTELQRIYDTLGLPVQQVLPRWQAYLQTLKGYKRNAFVPHPSDVAKVRQHLGFLYEKWAYPLPDVVGE